jgi:hypothetical protein
MTKISTMAAMTALAIAFATPTFAESPASSGNAVVATRQILASMPVYLFPPNQSDNG